MSATRRVRVYLAGLPTSEEQESRLRREADREFRVVQELRHDGIAQPLDLIQAERGPALLFDHRGRGSARPLGPGRGPPARARRRIELVRQLSEAVAHAHNRKVSHRALTARSVLVRPKTRPALHSAPQLVIGHWQAGARELATRLTTDTLTSDSTLGPPTERLDADEQVYLAPEAFIVDDPDGAALDVFSLGALAFLLLTGEPPAPDLIEREAIWRPPGLPLSAADDPPATSRRSSDATDPVPARRATVRELLELFDDALDELTAPGRRTGRSGDRTGASTRIRWLPTRATSSKVAGRSNDGSAAARLPSRCCVDVQAPRARSAQDRQGRGPRRTATRRSPCPDSSTTSASSSCSASSGSAAERPFDLPPPGIPTIEMASHWPID